MRRIMRRDAWVVFLTCATTFGLGFLSTGLAGCGDGAKKVKFKQTASSTGFPKLEIKGKTPGTVDVKVSGVPGTVSANPTGGGSGGSGEEGASGSNVEVSVTAETSGIDISFTTSSGSTFTKTVSRTEL